MQLRSFSLHTKHFITDPSVTDISFISTSTDTEFSSNTIESERIPYQRCILCFDELTKAKSKKLNYENIEQYDANLLGFEEIL